jgi:hypothetical protein
MKNDKKNQKKNGPRGGAHHTHTSGAVHSHMPVSPIETQNQNRRRKT